MGTGFRAAFAVPEFRVLWAAAALSTVGDQLARVALSVLVFQRTGSAAWTALTYALTMLPALVSGVLLTGLADRFPRRTVMVCADLLRAAVLALMALPGVPLPLVAALLVVAQLAEPPFAAAQGALLADVLGNRYEAGQSVHLITHQAGLLLGFAGGGLVVAWLGTSGALAADAVTFALSAVLLRVGLRHRPAPGGVTRARVRVLRGAALVWGDRRLRLLMALGWLALFTVVPEGLAAPFSAEVGAGAAAVGVLLAADPAGMVLGTVLLRLLPARRRVRLLGLLAVATALPLAVYLVRPGLAGAVALLALSGVFSAYQVTAGATFVRLVPDAHRGQALGFARSGLVAAQGVGVAGGGLLATAVGSAGTAIAIAGLAGTAAALLVTAAWSRTSTDPSITPPAADPPAPAAGRSDADTLAGSPAAAPPVGDPPVADPPAPDRRAEGSPVAGPPAADPPAADSTAENPPAEGRPAASPPVDSPSAESPSAKSSPATDTHAADRAIAQAPVTRQQPARPPADDSSTND